MSSLFCFHNTVVDNLFTNKPEKNDARPINVYIALYLCARDNTGVNHNSQQLLFLYGLHAGAKAPAPVHFADLNNENNCT